MANGSSTSQATTILATNSPNVVEAGTNRHGIMGTYADDDSAVSSEVTDDGYSDEISSDGDPEVAIITRAVETDIENDNVPRTMNVEIMQGSQQQQQQQQDQTRGKKGILPHNRREWCIVFFAIFSILAVAVGIGLGLGIFFSKNNDNITTVERGGPGDTVSGDTTDNDGGDDSSDTYSPTYSPSDFTPDTNSNFTPSMLDQPSGDDLAGAITYHMISQEISNIASFDDLTGDNGSNVNNTNNNLSAQQLAREFLIFRDTLPLAMMDEDDGQPLGNDSISTNDGDDDLLAIPSTDTTVTNIRPYLGFTTPAYRVAQRFAAVALYYATDGLNWESSNLWLEPGVHECDFVGVSCQELPIPAITLEEALQYPDDIPRHDDGSVGSTMERMIVAIDLPDNNMGGYIPQELTALPYLQRLGLWSNAIGGSLPSQLGKLSRLSSLLLDDNDLEGKIPREIGQLKEMALLFLGLNKGIIGRIPTELGGLSKLEQLNLANMSLKGGIPTTFGQLESLVDLHLENNSLSRGLPEELGNLVNLESLVLFGNEFTGDVPSSLRSLTNLKILI